MVSELFFGQQADVITCMVCGAKRSRVDRFLDLGLMMKTPFGEKLKGVKESLDVLFDKELLDGDNKLTCDSE